MKNKTIALAGNPNVGKSTVFNALTGMHQHTGNWPGKTVTNAAGNMKYKDATFDFIDLPGAYSLDSLSPDEAVTGEYIRSGKADIILIVADATCLERNLLLVKDILDITHDAVLCVNLMDEARKKGIIPDIGKLQELLRIPVIPASARSEEGLDELIEVLYSFAPGSFASERPADSSHPVDISSIYRQCVSFRKKEPCSFDRKLDRILTSKTAGIPVMLLLLLLIFWITMVGANYPSEALTALFSALDSKLRLMMSNAEMPGLFTAVTMDGLYKTVTWVIAVMLPPMAIFFPLFTLLEDFGYLPRVAFNLDEAFRRCGAHGKQSLTMCMGLDAMPAESLAAGS